MILAVKHSAMPVLLTLLAAALSACATTATTSSSFKGEQHAAAQRIANLQSAATAGEAGKICKQLLSGALVARLNASAGGCQQAIKKQLEVIDSFEVTVQSVKLGASGADTDRDGRREEHLRGQERAEHAHARQGRRRLEDIRAGLAPARPPAARLQLSAASVRTGARSRRDTRPSGSAPTTRRCRGTTRPSAPGPRPSAPRGSQPSARTFSEDNE